MTFETDWVDAPLVERARAKIGPQHVGGIVDAGFATDLLRLTVGRLFPLEQKPYLLKFHDLLKFHADNHDVGCSATAVR
jgi:hypothetical protein